MVCEPIIFYVCTLQKYITTYKISHLSHLYSAVERWGTFYFGYEGSFDSKYHIQKKSKIQINLESKMRFLDNLNEWVEESSDKIEKETDKKEVKFRLTLNLNKQTSQICPTHTNHLFILNLKRLFVHEFAFLILHRFNIREKI